MSMITGLMDRPAQNQAVPYVTIGPATAVASDTLNETGSSETLQLDFWDRDAPVSRVKQIMGRAITVLHRTNPPINGTVAVACNAEYAEVILEEDTMHGVLRVRVETFTS